MSRLTDIDLSHVRYDAAEWPDIEIDEGVQVCMQAITYEGNLVWHLIEVARPETAPPEGVTP